MNFYELYFFLNFFELFELYSKCFELHNYAVSVKLEPRSIRIS